MKKIILIRHAHSEANAGGITNANKAIQLSPKGIEQAQNLALGFDLIIPKKIYVSEMLRTQQTAEGFAQKYGLTPEIMPCLNEFTTLCHEELIGLTGEERAPFTEAYWQESDPYARHGKHADTFAEFYHFTTEFIEKLPEIEHLSVCFGHGMWMALLVWRILGYSQKKPLPEEMKYFRRFQLGLPMPNTAIYQLSLNTLNQPIQIEFMGSFAE